MGETRLSGVPVGGAARVLRLESGVGIRRRLLDMGLTEGAPCACLFASPSGDPRAYLVRGAVIALRNEDAASVYVEAVNDGKTCHRAGGEPQCGQEHGL